MSKNILIVDDEPDIRRLIRGILEDEGYDVREAESSTQAYDMMSEKPADLVVQDIWLQGSEHDGLQILSTVKKQYPYTQVIMISGHGTIETAVSAIKKGAYDFIEKPFKSDRLILMARRALEAAALRRENEYLKKNTTAPQNFIGTSAPIKALRQMLIQVAATNSRVLLTGEPGTGKNLAAHLIHKHSGRTGKPFVTLNCATLHPDHFETELFGQEGDVEVPGLLEKANGGVLFLDEVSDMPLETQGKIARVLQGQKFHRVGGTRALNVDVRIIAATNKNLEHEIEQGHFREDLYYRLNVVPINLPTLRECKEDIARLAEYFLEQLSTRLNLNKPELSKSALKALEVQKWPGNVRQFMNVLEWVLIMHRKTFANQKDAKISLEHLPPDIQANAKSHISSPSSLSNLKAVNDDSKNFDVSVFMSKTLREAREDFERVYLEEQIKRFDGHVSNMASFVQMERSALHRKLKSLNISTDKKSESC